VFATSRISSKLARLSVLGIAVGSLAGGFLVLESASPAGAATTMYVSSYGSDAGGNPCTSSAAPCLTLQHAYNEAGTGTTTIELASGTYKGDFGVPSIAFAGINLIEKNLNIVGSDNGGSLNVNTTTIDAEGKGAAIVDSGKTVNLTDLVVTNGTGETVDDGGTMTLTNVTVGAGTGSPTQIVIGEGVVNTGKLTMNGGSIAGFTTSASLGAGLYNEGTVATLKNVSITHDSTTSADGEGGGIFNLDGTVHLEGTTALHDNSATVDGGGIENCKSNGAVVTFGSGVVDTANTPNDYSTADPAHDC
jgi:hypothetical protein